MNNITIVGRLTKDPELRFIEQLQKNKATFTAAVDRQYKNKDGNKITDFIPVEAIGRVADFCGNYLSKGRLVSVQGELHTESWKDENGNWKNRAYINARLVNALDSMKNSDSNTQQEFEPSGLDTGGYGAIDDDDIPF